MLDRAMLFGLGASVAALFFVLELVRRRKLREDYSLLWLATALVLIILSVSRPLLDMLAALIGIFYPPSALFLVAMVFVLFILLHFSTVLTKLTRENKEIAQQMALLRWELDETRRALAAARENRGDQQNEQERADIQ
jgi:hypothetical protein